MAKEFEPERFLNSLITNDKGKLTWREDIKKRSPARDPRRDFQSFVKRWGRITSYSEFSPILNSDDLVEVKKGEFVTSRRECVRPDGLLRIIDKFPVQLSKPPSLILVGILNPNSLLAVLKWLEIKGWNDTQVTVVDVSSIPLETTRLMIEKNCIPKSFKIDLIHSDILDYKPTRQPNFIIADILNTWMVPQVFVPSFRITNPYFRYRKFLEWVRQNTCSNGWFLSRCLILPEKPRGNFPSHSLFPLVGKRAERVFQYMYESNFRTVHLIKVINRVSGYTHLNFLCR
jgi:hypothetical protein